MNNFFNEAIEHSARNQCHCGIRWFIVAVEKEEEKKETQEKRKARIEKLVAAKISVLVAESKKAESKTADSKKAEVKNKWKKAVRRSTIFTLKHRPMPAYMTVAKIGTKVGAKVVAKNSAKFGGKSVAKKIPVVGLAAGCAFGIFRLVQGDYLGAAMELGSGAASVIPGYGTAASFAIDGVLVAYDLAA